MSVVKKRKLTRGPRKGQWVEKKQLYPVPGTHPVWQCIVSAYTSRGQTADEALLMARMARILRHEDYLPEENAILLWHPVKSRREKWKLESSD